MTVQSILRSTPHVPVPLLRRLGVVMTPEPGDPLEVEGVLNPGVGPRARTASCTCCRDSSPPATSRASASPGSSIDDGVPVGVEREGVVLEPDRGWERGGTHAGRRGPAGHLDSELGLHVMTYVAYGPLGPRHGLAVSRRPARVAAARARCTSTTRTSSTPTSNLFPTRTRCSSPSRSRARTASELRGAAPADVGPRRRRAGEGTPAGRRHRRPAGHLDQLRAGRRGGRGRLLG